MPTPKRQSAFFRATQEAQTEKPSQSGTVAPSHSDTVEQEKSDTVALLQGGTVVPPQSDGVKQVQRNVVEQRKSDTVTLPHGETVEQVQRDTVIPSHGDTDTPLNAGKKDHKTSFYLTREQIDKLDDLAYEYKKRTGQRINRNDIVRHLINQCGIDSLSGIQV